MRVFWKIPLKSPNNDKTQDGRADMTNFEMDLFDTRMSGRRSEKEEETCCSSSRQRLIKPACLPITIIALFLTAIFFFPLFHDEDLIVPNKLPSNCDQECKLELTESLPAVLGLNSTSSPTHLEWIGLIDGAEKSIDIAAFYWNLLSNESPSASAGKEVFNALVRAGKRNVQIRIAQDRALGISNNSDSAYLAENGLAKVRTLNFTDLLGCGVLHTKFILVDMKHAYVGSANMDWKSLTEVKELGLTIRNCSCIVADLFKVFAVYWKLGEDDAKVPTSWPIVYRTQYNYDNQMPITIASVPYKLFISSSPSPFNPKGREHDLDAILSVISDAKKSVSVSVMDYIPETLYEDKKRFWPSLDNALRDAAFRGVTVRLLVSHWNYTRPSIKYYLKSMVDANPAYASKGSVEVKLFTFPESARRIPFTGVNHNKYMVSETTAYIGTSNWAGDYFINTAGVGFVLTPTSASVGDFRSKLQDVFNRDWNSKYALSL